MLFSIVAVPFISTLMFTEALFITGKMWKQSKCSLTYE